MPTRRIIKGVLGNFLGTYVSRYSDYNGRLLFGFLVGNLDDVRINLLGQEVHNPDSPMGAAILSAIARFDEQRQRAGLDGARIHEAWLTIKQLPGPVLGAIHETPCLGFNVEFTVEAVMDDSKRYQRNRVVFIAPN